MSPQEDEKLQHVDNPLAVMAPGERVLCHIERHPFGLIGVYFIAALLLVLLFAGVGILPHYVTSLTTQDKLYAFAGATLLAVVVLLYVYVTVIIYKGNRWIVTDDSITQITQTGLFQKQSSQLSLENLEDVTFEQGNMLQSMIGFGTLHVETAGEHSKFVFPYCPNPNKYAKEIIQAHEDFMAEHYQQASAAPPSTPTLNQQYPQAYVPPQATTPVPPPPSNDGPNDQY
jgi:uncharacterized membrane protein YdbT with pleckstrin-like domain